MPDSGEGRIGFTIHAQKIAGYLLDLDHVRGGPKARFFMAFGFTPSEPGILASALLAHPTLETRARETATPAGDVRLIYEGPLTTPDGRNPRIRTVWQLDVPDEARFITAVPLP